MKTPLNEIAELEKDLADLTVVQGSKDQLEAEIEKTTARKKRELNPQLKPLDKADKSLKGRAINFVKTNRKNTEIFSKGKKSLHTRAGTVGFSKGRPALKVPRRLEEEDFVALVRGEGLGHLVDTAERVNRTRLRQGIQAGEVDKETAQRLGVRVTRREHYWVKTKTAKRSRPSSAKGRGKRKDAAKKK